MELTAYTTAVGAFLKKWALRWKNKGLWQIGAAGVAGFALAGASAQNRAMPVALGLVCTAPPGWSALAAALGGCAGYWIFWKESQGAVWMALGLLAVLLTGDKPIVRQQKALLPSVAALIVSASGLGFLIWMWDDTPVGVYLLRVLSGAASAAVFQRKREEPSGAAGWLSKGLWTLALSRFGREPVWNLGYAAAGFFGVRSAFPGAALAGLGVDLAGDSPVTMTGALCLCFCLRLIPGLPDGLLCVGPGAAYLVLSAISGRVDIRPLPALLLGGALGLYLPGENLSGSVLRRKGVTGLAQVRLEKGAGAMHLLQQALLQGLESPVDKAALLRQGVEEACDTCPERKHCKTRQLLPDLPEKLLEQPGLQPSDLPAGCKKSARVLTGLRRAQEQLRRIKEGRAVRRSCRSAMLDQLEFVEEYLKRLSDGLCAAPQGLGERYDLDLGVCGRSLKGTSGDLCISFDGTGSKRYVLLCDGMGTGDAAREDSEQTAKLLSAYLQAGFSPVQALRSFNSLCALTGTGGCATADLLEVDLHSGSAALYKWGAWPSYLLVSGQLKKIGTAGPPPGLSQLARETVDRLSLGGGEVLIMLSDGAGEEGLWQPDWTVSGVDAGEMAHRILEQGAQRFDDATVAVVRLTGCDTSVPRFDSECCRNTRC